MTLNDYIFFIMNLKRNLVSILKYTGNGLASSTWKVLKDIDFQKPCEGILVLLDSRSKLW